MEDQAGRAAEHEGVAGGEPDRARAVAPPQAADAEHRLVAKRQRHHGSVQLSLVAILVQAHAGVGLIEVHQAGFRVRRIP
jgi:hypothetical protein